MPLYFAIDAVISLILAVTARAEAVTCITLLAAFSREPVAGPKEALTLVIALLRLVLF